MSVLRIRVKVVGVGECMVPLGFDLRVGEGATLLQDGNGGLGEDREGGRLGVLSSTERSKLKLCLMPPGRRARPQLEASGRSDRGSPGSCA